MARGASSAAMLFNFVVLTNARAAALACWVDFEIICRLSEAFRHLHLELVDGLVMQQRF